MGKTLAAIGVWTLLGAAACAPAAQQIASPTSAPAEPARSQQTNSPETAPQILMDERFAHSWPDDPRGPARFASGGYLVSTRVPGEFAAIRAPLADVPRDVVVSATFHKVGGPAGGGYGLIVRDQGSSSGDGLDQTGQYVVAEVGDRGIAGIWRRDNNQWTDLLPWVRSTAVRVDSGDNDLTVQLLGDRLTFLANGEQIANIQIGVGGGSVGLFVGGDSNEVLIDRFLVQVPGRPTASQPAASSARPVATVAVPARPAVVPQARPQPQPQPGPASGRDDSAPAEAQRLGNLLSGLATDVLALMSSFADGFDGNHSPVNDPIALHEAQNRLDAATSKAREVQAELDRVQNGAADRGR